MYFDFFGNDPFWGAQDYYANFYRTFFWVIGLAIAAVGIGIILNFSFLRKSNEGRFKGFWGKVYDFLSMNRFYTEDIIKLLEVITFLAVTFIGIYMMCTGSVGGGLLLIIFGNLFARICYELIIMFAILTRKTVSMDKRLAGIEKFYSDDMDDWEGEKEDSGFPEADEKEEGRELTFEEKLKEAFGDIEEDKKYGYDEECRECDNWDEISEDCYCEDDCLTCEKPDNDRLAARIEESAEETAEEAPAEPAEETAEAVPVEPEQEL